MSKKAMDEFKDLLGESHVLTEDDQFGTYRQANIPVHRNIKAVVKPATLEEVQEIVKIAGNREIKLYPISTGNNWGYGSANPVSDNNVIVDLGRMNRIIEVNTKLAYAVIEPGVTQEQLADYLRENKTGLIMDPTGSGPSCSVLGNTLERGYGITPYGDHFEAMCGMEVVLADGVVVRTGFGHFKNARATRLFKYGTGPYLDGLFTQSNYGVVTSIGVWLMPEPECFEMCYFFCDTDEGLENMIDVTRWLLLNRVVKGSINVMHRNRLLTLMMQYPWEVMNQKTPLSEEVAKAFARKKDVAEWNGVASLYGTREEVKAAKKVIKRKLKHRVDRINFLPETVLTLIDRHQWLVNPLGRIMGMDIKELVEILKPSFSLLRGTPCEISLPTPYWRMKKKMPASGINPARDNCGIYWFAPVIPMEEENMREFIGIVNPILSKYGFDSCLTFTAVTSRSFDCTLPLLYNKEDLEETNRAAQCYTEMMETCMDLGFIPYRFGIQSMEALMNRDDTFWDLAEKIKKAVDPQCIFSPGRYSRI